MSSRRLSLLYKLSRSGYLFQSLFIPFYPFLSPDFSTMSPAVCTKRPASGRSVAFGGRFYSLVVSAPYILARACSAEPWSLKVRFRYLSAFSS